MALKIMSNVFLFINKSLQKVFSSKRTLGSKVGKPIKIPSPPKKHKNKRQNPHKQHD